MKVNNLLFCHFEVESAKAFGEKPVLFAQRIFSHLQSKICEENRRNTTLEHDKNLGLLGVSFNLTRK